MAQPPYYKDDFSAFSTSELTPVEKWFLEVLRVQRVTAVAEPLAPYGLQPLPHHVSTAPCTTNGLGDFPVGAGELNASQASPSVPSSSRTNFSYDRNTSRQGPFAIVHPEARFPPPFTAEAGPSTTTYNRKKFSTATTPSDSVFTGSSLVDPACHPTYTQYPDISPAVSSSSKTNFTHNGNTCGHSTFATVQPEPLFPSPFTTEAGPACFPSTTIYNPWTVATATAPSDPPSSVVEPACHPTVSGTYTQYPYDATVGSSSSNVNLTYDSNARGNSTSAAAKPEAWFPVPSNAEAGLLRCPSATTYNRGSTVSPESWATTPSDSVLTPCSAVDQSSDPTESDTVTYAQYPDMTTVAWGDAAAVAGHQAWNATQKSYLHADLEIQSHNDVAQQKGRNHPRKLQTALNDINAAYGQFQRVSAAPAVDEPRMEVSRSPNATPKATSVQPAAPSVSVSERVSCDYKDPITGHQCLKVGGFKNMRTFERHYSSIHVQEELKCIKEGSLSRETAVALNASWVQRNVHVCPEVTCRYRAEHDGQPWSITSYGRIDRAVKKHKDVYHPHTLRNYKAPECEKSIRLQNEPVAVPVSVPRLQPAPADAPLPTSTYAPGPSKRGGQNDSQSCRQSSNVRYQPY